MNKAALLILFVLFLNRVEAQQTTFNFTNAAIIQLDKDTTCLLHLGFYPDYDVAQFRMNLEGVHQNYILNHSLQIFDRWGSTLAETSEKNVRWESRFPGGVRFGSNFLYYYKYSYTNQAGETISIVGTFTYTLNF